MNKEAIGKKCFEIYAGRKSICPNCPAEKTIEAGIENKKEVKELGEVTVQPIKNNNGETIAVTEIAKGGINNG